MSTSLSSDGDLLRRFRLTNDQEAVAELLRRHGRAVLNAAQSVVWEPAAAQDVVQAVFVAMTRKAASLEPARCVAGWLCHVAVCLARSHRRQELRRRAREREVAMNPAHAEAPASMPPEVRAALYEELGRISDAYRQAIVLHHLEGLSYGAAAAQCGCTEKAFSVRLARAREKLRQRLVGRGVVLGVGGVAFALEQTATAVELPASVAASICNAASALAAGTAGLGGAVSAQVAALTQGALKMLFWTQVKTVAVVCAVAVLAASAVPLGLAIAHAGGAPAATPTAAAAVPAEAPKAAPAVAAVVAPAAMAAGVPGELKVPAGFKAAPGTKTEPYTKTGWAQEIVHATTGMALVFVPAGEFLMGSPADEAGRIYEETQHRVTLTKGFYLGKYEVTQAQWAGVMGDKPSYFKGRDNNPVEMVSWDDCQAFIQNLNAALLPPTSDKRQATIGFRLPTEAEWEYACRAGTKGPYAGNLDELGWYRDNSADETSRRTTHPVGQKQPNAWGLYDMHGNVWEWCADWHIALRDGAVIDSTSAGAGAGQFRAFRGGGLDNGARECRAAFSIWMVPGVREDYLGCRLAFSPTPGQ